MRLNVEKLKEIDLENQFKSINSINAIQKHDERTEKFLTDLHFKRAKTIEFLASM